MTTPEPTVLLERHDPLVVLRFNRPAVRNALDAATLEHALQLLHDVDADPNARVLVLTGTGDKAFIAGADIQELARRTMHTELGRRARLMREVCNLLETMAKPALAAVNGAALGGGCEVALSCDMRFAASTAKLGLPEVNLGLFPGGGGTQRLLRLCGRAVAAELMMTGAIIDADEALRIGLVNRVIPPERLLPVVMNVGAMIASKSPFAIRAIKDALRAGANTGQAEGILYENKLFALCMESEDKHEGVTAFLEKRPPVFTGR